MSGTRIGGAKARDTNKLKWGESFYRDIGTLGGRKSRNGGFTKKAECLCDLFPVPHTIPRCAGKKGGTKSRRGKSKPEIISLTQDEAKILFPKKHWWQRFTGSLR